MPCSSSRPSLTWRTRPTAWLMPWVLQPCPTAWRLPTWCASLSALCWLQQKLAAWLFCMVLLASSCSCDSYYWAAFHPISSSVIFDTGDWKGSSLILQVLSSMASDSRSANTCRCQSTAMPCCSLARPLKCSILYAPAALCLLNCTLQFSFRECYSASQHCSAVCSAGLPGERTWLTCCTHSQAAGDQP